jgi:hypothetical protein
LSVMCVVCCQVEVSATNWSLVQRNPTDCRASLCVITKPRERAGHSPRWAAEPEKIINNMYMCVYIAIWRSGYYFIYLILSKFSHSNTHAYQNTRRWSQCIRHTGRPKVTMTAVSGLTHYVNRSGWVPAGPRHQKRLSVAEGLRTEIQVTTKRPSVLHVPCYS